jgi:RimJ/RimL family protein N-acetyltransferase
VPNVDGGDRRFSGQLDHAPGGGTGAPAGRLGCERRIDQRALLTDTRQVDAATLKREFDRDLILNDGACVRLRPVVPEDEAGLIALHERLSQQSAYQRFFTIMPRLPSNWAHHLANVDYRQRLALVAVDPQTASLIGVARYEATSDPATVEVAFVVQDSWQNRGLGTRLFGELLRAAALNGIARFRAWVLADNRRMLDLIARFGAIVGRTLDQGVVDVAFEAPARASAALR